MNEVVGRMEVDVQSRIEEGECGCERANKFTQVKYNKLKVNT